MWSTDVLLLQMYHVLVDDSICIEFTKESCKELDGRNSGLFVNFYEQAAKKFNNSTWVPKSLSIPEVHDDFGQSKPLPLNVTLTTAEIFHKKLADSRYKMVK